MTLARRNLDLPIKGFSLDGGPKEQLVLDLTNFDCFLFVEHLLGRGGRAQRLRGEPHPVPAGDQPTHGGAQRHEQPRGQLQADAAGPQQTVHLRSC